ncbi:hypothetical protein H072_942 [Dactylellina haptotyla CBS 200.50]|uniref:Uncharacterized protein n=1 Tax=Dactylellina haptotyla (strain CBS 200.50) TaxID=1284197 RepID=S8AQ55_DACHA|nr:hypothetical protein H072_942 [Dactylellina haptotyla CBS 200.50]
MVDGPGDHGSGSQPRPYINWAQSGVGLEGAPEEVTFRASSRKNNHKRQREIGNHRRRSSRAKVQTITVYHLACPLAKRRPDIYGCCLDIARQNLAGIKEHMRRNHGSVVDHDLVKQAGNWHEVLYVCFPDDDRRELKTINKYALLDDTNTLTHHTATSDNNDTTLLPNVIDQSSLAEHANLSPDPSVYYGPLSLAEVSRETTFTLFISEGLGVDLPGEAIPKMYHYRDMEDLRQGFTRWLGNSFPVPGFFWDYMELWSVSPYGLTSVEDVIQELETWYPPYKYTQAFFWLEWR